jgi:peptidyl-prolyl cis-trans isomerase A (cyclophilin A)
MPRVQASPRNAIVFVVGLLLLLPGASGAGEAVGDPDTDWLRDARYGVFVHFLPGDAEALARVDDFDVDALARQLESVGAGYLILTLGQNSGFFNAPNPTYDRITGYAPGERTSSRDLPADLQRALEERGIRLMLYLPCQAPNEDRRAQRAFGLPEGAKDQPIDVAFARQWAEVIRDWSVRYGDRVAGWWFDGGYEWVGFDEEIAGIYAEAAREGNPAAIVTFNPGIGLKRWTRAESYTAGELQDPFDVLPDSRWLEGSQWHVLTYLGSRWSGRDTRHPADRWAEWVRAVTAREGVVTLDLGPNWDPQAGPIGSLADAQLEQVVAVRDAVREPPRVRIETGVGSITVELDPVRAPVTTRNFLRYVEEGFYSDGAFFRTVTATNQPDDPVRIAVIQGGASPEKEDDEHAPIPIERTRDTGLRHLDGTISMARLGPDTATQSFFICVGDQPELDFGGRRNPDGQGFAAFGRVVEGMDVVRAIHVSPAKGQALEPPVAIRRVVRLP